MPATRIEQNNKAIMDAIAAGQRLHIGVTLSYVGDGSDKFWTAVWARNRIAVNYGRHHSAGAFDLHDNLTDTEGAKKLWGLLRSKVGKGYAVVDAATLVVNPGAITAHPTTAPALMVGSWLSLRQERVGNAIRSTQQPEMLGTSPRTPTQGAQVLLNVTSPNATPEVLAGAVVVGPSERFLPPIVASRPDLPYEVKFMAALSGNAKIVL